MGDFGLSFVRSRTPQSKRLLNIEMEAENRVDNDNNKKLVMNAAIFFFARIGWTRV